MTRLMIRIRFPEDLRAKLLIFGVGVLATVATYIVLRLFVMDDVRCAVAGCKATTARINAAHAAAENFSYGCVWLVAAVTLLAAYRMALLQCLLLSKYFPLTRQGLVRPVFGFGQFSWLDLLEKIWLLITSLCFLGALTAFVFFAATALPLAIHY